MKTLPLIIALYLVAHLAAADDAPSWRTAEPGWRYSFPRDHGVHDDFKTEWWYFTGELKTADGYEFGYELTWFRQGLMPALPPGSQSRFLVRDFKFAHFAVTDVQRSNFSFAQKISRGAYGDAGFGDGNPGPLAWIDNWRLTVQPDGSWRIAAEHDGRKLDLRLTPAKPPVIEGENGVSRKADGPGHASCYYSFTRMQATGTLTSPGANDQSVTGETWFDHEWATNQLAPGQAGWDWFSLQLNDGAELMLYRMRLTSGAADRASSGTYIRRDGSVTYLKSDDFALTPVEWWRSAATGGNYPIRWHIEIARLALKLDVSTPVKNQELALPALAYWEGLIHATGAVGASPLAGHGYLELTGYQHPLTTLGP
jgi:predicted secreted hydrolase